MSAYMVEDKCINFIVTWLFNPRHEWEKTRVLEALTLTTSDHQKELGTAMFQMNVRGVNARYGENQAQEFRDLDYEWSPVYTDSGYAVYDKLGEFLYQCSEEDIPEIDPLYRALHLVYDNMAHTFFRNLRESKEERDADVRRELNQRITALEQCFTRQRRTK